MPIYENLKDEITAEITRLLDAQSQELSNELLSRRDYLAALAADLAMQEIGGQVKDETVKHLKAQVLNIACGGHQADTLNILAVAVRRSLEKVICNVGTTLLKGVI
jgi:hypothetical protein